MHQRAAGFEGLPLDTHLPHPQPRVTYALENAVILPSAKFAPIAHMWPSERMRIEKLPDSAIKIMMSLV